MGAALLAALCMLLWSLGIATLASFTGTTANSGSTFTAATAFSAGTGMRLASGKFAGDGVDNRAITGVGFRPDAVIIRSDISKEMAVMRTSTMTGDATKPLVGGTALTANLIQSLDADGFTVGNSVGVNSSSSARVFWIAFKAAAGQMKVGSYTGNGTGQSMTGLGFAPEYVIVASASAHSAVHRSSTMGSPYLFERAAADTGAVTSLDADGFSVGSGLQANQNGTTYHYLAWNATAGAMSTGTYTGTGGDYRSVTGVGFQAGYLIVRVDGTPSPGCGESPVHAPTIVPFGVNNIASLLFATGIYASNFGVHKFEPDGFQVRTDCAVNDAGKNYHWVAFKDSP
ncbi:MAG TPA: hypothetical protein VHF25_11700 [Nitriliruptorales bacterium]|nr:hypothetical protein [Nitriliruptorales bacterium]